jgi:hypothetical protein
MMNKKFTDEEIVRAAHCCTKNNCKTCPFIVLGAGFKNCVIKFSEYIANNTKNEPAPAATGTSSEVSVKEDTSSTQFDDSILLDICQEGLCTVAQNRNADYQIGYATAMLDVIKKLKGGGSNDGQTIQKV